MIPITKPLLGEPEAEAARRVILSGWTTQGPEVAAFEQEFADYVGAAHACAVSSCTAALHLALLAVGVQPGDHVITVSHSYIATANAIRYCGAIPVFVDIDPATYTLDPKLLEAALGPLTRAILVVHQLGMPCAMAAILDLAHRHAIPVIEDAACAIGSEIRWQGHWQKIGKPHADIACFSFHPRKIISTGDGGMITSAKPEWDAICKQLRQHGMSVPDSVRHNANQVIFESYPRLGYNFRLTDIQAAIGREQLKRLPGIIARRRDLADRYRTLLAGRSDIGLPMEPDWARSAWQSFSLRLPEQANQRQVMQTMLDLGVATRRGVMCAHREAAYPAPTWACAAGGKNCGCLPGECRKLVHSEQAQDQTIILPLFPQMTDAQQDEVVQALYAALGKVPKPLS